MSLTTKTLGSSCGTILCVAVILALPVFGLAANAALAAGIRSLPEAQVLGGNPPGVMGLLPGWTYKTPVTITNPGVVVTDYQVRIDLNTGNFDFAQANSDGSDIRFTATDGATLLPYWVESWTAGTSGTFWVRVSSIPAGGSLTIYLYSGNVSAVSASNGSATFSFFEDFEASPWTAWNKEIAGIGTLVQSADLAKRGGKSGKFDQPTGASSSTVFSRAFSLPGTNFVQEWDFYDDNDQTAFKMVRANYQISGGQIGAGVWTGSSTTRYAFHSTGYSYTPTSVNRAVGWHKIGITVSGGAANFFIDGSASLGSLSGLPTTFNRISIEGIPDGPTTYYVDDFRVRTYISQTLTVAIGQAGQPAPDMAISMTDSPDPARVNQQVTYAITVNNYGDQDATNVTVTDVLPANVTFVSAVSSQGSCSGTSTVTGNLGTVASGASATVTIVVVATAQGQLSNAATVTCTETDPNPANNSATATTGVGDPVVYIVNAVDTEAFDDHQMTPQHRPFDLHNYIRGQSTYIEPLMASSFRNANKDSYGTPFKMSWFMEMDNYINNGVYADGSSMNYLTLYNTFQSNFGTELATWGDEMANHHHFMTWNGTTWVQLGDGTQLGTTYDEHNNALDRMVLDGGFFPTDFRSGWLWTSNQTQAWVEQWMLADYSGPFGGRASYVSYHPSAADYTQSGSMNHWITGADGIGANAASLAAAFAQAAATGRPVIYAWYCHDRDNMPALVSAAQALAVAAQASTGVPFRYATAKEAMQAVMGTTDTTPPTLAVSPAGGANFSITSNEAVWNNKPYVAARYLAPSGLKYEHDAAVSAGTNSWTVALPDQKTLTTVIPGVKYPLVGATASEYENVNVPGLAIDGNEGTYWASAVLPAWITVDAGEVRSVPRMTVHFYDGDARTYTYTIEASTDGTGWTQIVASTTTHGTATYDFGSPVSMRYARVNVTGASANPHAHVLEIALYQTLPGSTSEIAYLQQVGVGAGDLSGNTSVATTVVRALADVAVSMTAPASVGLGDDLTYSLTVTNNGPAPASGVQVTDVLPAGVTYVSAISSQGSCTGTSTVVADLGAIASGASATVTIVVYSNTENTYANTASVTSSSADANQTNNSATVSTVVMLAPADVALTMTATPPMVFLGNNLTYNLTVTNNGPSAASGIQVTDVLPVGVSYVSATSSQGSCGGTTTVVADLGGLASGASATVTIVVLPSAEGTYVNTASVTSSSATTDPLPANNSATVSTPVGNPVVYIVSAVDTEPFDDHQMTPQHRPFNLTNYIRGQSTYIEPLMESTFRNANRDSYGTPFKMTWFMEMDGYINNGIYADGSPMNYLTLYNTFQSNFGTELATWGDEMANHHHFMTWNGTTWVQLTDGSQLGTTYDEHNNALDRMVLDAGFFPTTYRSGWLWESNQLQAWIEQWMLADYGYGGSPSQPDGMNHWNLGSDGGPNATNINAAFAQAAATGRPVIYSWYCHDRDNMPSIISNLQSLATAAQGSSGVPFKYATAKQAMQAWMSTTDTTPPVLTVSAGAPGSFSINSNEPVWNNKPYVAARYLAPSGLSYSHTAAVSAGTNSWTATFPDQQTFTAVVPATKYSLAGVTASSAKPGNPPASAIDGNETTYWDSYELPQWISVDAGSVKPVARMTVHFYDADGRNYTYSIDASTDGTNWTQLVASTTVSGTATHDFDPAVILAANLRYARVNITAGSAGVYGHILEINLYQNVGGGTVEETAYLQQVGAGAGDLSGNTSVASAIVRSLADIAVTMTGTPSSMELGGDLTYNVTVRNDGPSPAPDVQVTDVLPAGVTFVSATSSQGTCSGTSTVTAALGNILSGMSATVTIVVHPTALGTYENTASAAASAPSTDPNLTNNSASVSTNVSLALADVAVTMTATPTSVKLGNDLTYNLTVTNHGPSAASGVVATDVLPVGATFVSATSSQGSCSGTSTVTAALGNILSGASATVTIVVHPTAEGTYLNTASVTSSPSTTDPVPANNSASVSTVVGNPAVYVVIAIDTEADNNHPMGAEHTVFTVGNYQRVGDGCPSFTTKYSGDGTLWGTYADGTTFNFEVTATGETVPVTSFRCGFNNAYGLDDYARAVRFTVPADGSYDVGLQLSVIGSPPATNIYVVPDVGGNPDVANPMSTYTATATGFTSGEYVVIGTDLALQADHDYWWVASKQSSGNDLNQFAVYQGNPTASNTFSRIMDSSFRTATTDSYGRSFRMSWYMEMDNFFNNGFYTDGRPMNYLTLYYELMNNWGTEVRGYGDEIAYHHHFMIWNGTSWQMGGQEHAVDGEYDWHNEALDHMVLDAGFYPTNFRAGWLNNDNQMQEWIERRMLSDDGGINWATGWQPYHPSSTDYTQVGEMKHWMMNCPGGPSQGGVDAAFAQSIAENRPVVYCWYMHQRDDMRGLVASAHTMLQTAAAANLGVTFKYATAQEAMRAVIGTTDVTPPVLTVVPTGSDVYTITSSETLLGAGPHVAGRYGTGSTAVYTHVTVTPGGSANTWTATLPPWNAGLPLDLVGAGALDLAGNSAVTRGPTCVAGEVCSTGQLGVCAAGTQQCPGGVPVCVPNVAPSAETCNGLDDDCDGVIDEGLGSTACGVGTCQRTVQNCVGGTSQTCAPGAPGAEACNGLDDDCDGVADNGHAVMAIADAIAGTPNQPVTVPITIGSVAGMGVYSSESHVTFDSNVLTATDVVMNSALGAFGCAIESSFDNGTTPGQGHVSVAVFCTASLMGNQPLANVTFNVRGGTCGATTALHFASAKLNEGCPAAVPDDGSVAAKCDVSGAVYYYRNNGGSGSEPSTKPVPGVVVHPSGGGGNATTDGFGLYVLFNLAGDQTIAPLGKTGDFYDAIGSSDAAAVAMASVGSIPQLSANQFLAGDVTGNHTLSALDASNIARFAVGLVAQFPVATLAGSDWTFRKCSADPFACDDPAYAFTPIGGNETAVDFYAILYGDVTGNWPYQAQTLASRAAIPSEENDALIRDRAIADRFRREGAPPVVERRPGMAPAELSLSGWKPLRAGERAQITVDLRNADGILGLDLVLKYDPSRLAIVGVQAAGIGSALSVVRADQHGTQRIAAYGYAALSGSGSILTITVEGLRNKGPQQPPTIGGVANEGGIPLR